MQVKTYDQDCPLLVATDYIYVVSGLRFDGAYLVDEAIGARHAIHPRAALFLEQLRRGISYAHVQTYSRIHDLSQEDIASLLGFINRIGGLGRTRYARGQVDACKRMIIYRRRITPLTRRFPATLGGIGRAALRATTPVLIAGVGVAILLAYSNLLQPAAVIAFCGMIGLFVASLIIHEYAHSWVLRRHCIEGKVIQAGMRLGIIHRATSSAIEQKSAWIGPLAGMATCVIMGLLLFVIGHAPEAFAASIVGLFHCSSLLPWYADGALIWKATRV